MASCDERSSTESCSVWHACLKTLNFSQEGGLVVNKDCRPSPVHFLGLGSGFLGRAGDAKSMALLEVPERPSKGLHLELHDVSFEILSGPVCHSSRKRKQMQISRQRERTGLQCP